MSIIDTVAHSVQTYDPKNSKAFTGQRLAKFSWKTITDKTNALCGIKRESKCVSLPLIQHVDIESNLVALSSHLTGYLHGVQDKMIREMIEAGSGNGEVKHVTQESISIAAICEWLESNDESGRLTKESVASWFDAEIAESLMVVLADKLGVSDTPSKEQEKQIEVVMGQFKDKISSLAGGKTSYEPKMCESLKKCLELAPAGDAMSVRFTARLDKMIEASKTSVNLIDLL